MKRLVAPLILSCLAVSLYVDAAGRGNGRMGMVQPPTFAEIDVNQDAVLTPEEFDAFQKTRQELRQSEGRLLRNSSYSEGMFERIDIDDNGFIEQDEFLSHRGRLKASNI